jgi:hypothetical protein
MNINSIFTNIKNHLPKRKAEEGNAFLMYMLLMPVLVLTVGFGMQIGINQYVRLSLQSSAEAAVQSAATLAQNGGLSGANVSLSAAVADKAKELYAKNRLNNIGGLVCGIKTSEYWTGTFGERVSAPGGCDYINIFTSIYYRNGQPYIRMVTANGSHNTFGAIFGTDVQSYTISAEARITRSGG